MHHMTVIKGSLSRGRLRVYSALFCPLILCQPAGNVCLFVRLYEKVLTLTKTMGTSCQDGHPVVQGGERMHTSLPFAARSTCAPRRARNAWAMR